MKSEQQKQPSASPTAQEESYQDLVRKLADRIYEMWERELRHERERKGSKGR